MDKNYKVCFACTGNACRSPFAESVVKALLKEQGTEGVEVSSLGTLDWGENPRDVTMAEIAHQMGYELHGTTTHMSREALMEADSIVVFDQYQHNAVTRELDYSRWSRIVLFDQIAFGIPKPVEDPNGRSIEVYRRVAQHIEEGCRRIVEQWK